jgi:hypothetical protein
MAVGVGVIKTLATLEILHRGIHCTFLPRFYYIMMIYLIYDFTSVIFVRVRARTFRIVYPRHFNDCHNMGEQPIQLLYTSSEYISNSMFSLWKIVTINSDITSISLNDDI